jgi:hypothetical protein
MVEKDVVWAKWKTYEVVERDAAGEFTTTPVSAAFIEHAPQAAPAIAKMQRVQDMGFHEAREQMYVAGKKRKKAIVRPDKEDPPIWELKCTPHAWRLFFYIYEKSTDKRIIYLHADYKTTRKQDAGAVASARRRRGSAGHPATQEFEFPDRAVPHAGIRNRLG